MQERPGRYSHVDDVRWTEGRYMSGG